MTLAIQRGEVKNAFGASFVNSERDALEVVCTSTSIEGACTMPCCSGSVSEKSSSCICVVVDRAGWRAFDGW